MPSASVTRCVLVHTKVCTIAHKGVHNSTQRCVILTHLFTYNKKTQHGVLENTPMCARKHINMCKKTLNKTAKETVFQPTLSKK